MAKYIKRFDSGAGKKRQEEMEKSCLQMLWIINKKSKFIWNLNRIEEKILGNLDSDGFKLLKDLFLPC